MKKILIIGILLLIGLGLVTYYQDEKEVEFTATALAIKQVIAKRQDDDKSYLTVVIDDFIVEEYVLNYNEIEFIAETEVYESVVVGDPYVGVSLKIPYRMSMENHAEFHREFVNKLRTKDVEGWMIVNISN